MKRDRGRRSRVGYRWGFSSLHLPWRSSTDPPFRERALFKVGGSRRDINPNPRCAENESRLYRNSLCIRSFPTFWFEIRFSLPHSKCVLLLFCPLLTCEVRIRWECHRHPSPFPLSGSHLLHPPWHRMKMVDPRSQWFQAHPAEYPTSLPVSTEPIEQEAAHLRWNRSPLFNKLAPLYPE